MERVGISGERSYRLFGLFAVAMAMKRNARAAFSELPGDDAANALRRAGD